MTPHDRVPVVLTDRPPTEPARLVDDFTPALIDVGAHHLCPGCGEPIAMRSVLEVIAELELAQRTIAVFGIGCYTAFSNNLDVEVLQALHGRAPSLATGAKRARPETVVFTVQGDGDMVNEGLQEVIHTAARGENVTCIMLNNGVFGETGDISPPRPCSANAPRTAWPGGTQLSTATPFSSPTCWPSWRVRPTWRGVR